PPSPRDRALVDPPQLPAVARLVAEPPLRLTRRLLTRPAFPHLLLHHALEVKRQLVLQIALRALQPKQPTKRTTPSPHARSPAVRNTFPTASTYRPHALSCTASCRPP